MGDFDGISSLVLHCAWGTRATQKTAITRKGAGPISLLRPGDNCGLKVLRGNIGEAGEVQLKPIV